MCLRGREYMDLMLWIACCAVCGLVELAHVQVNLQASSKADLATLREQLQETQNALGAARAEKQTAERALEAAQLAHKETVATTNHTHKEQVRALEQQVAALREDLRLQEQTSQAEMTSARSNERAAVQKLDAAVQEAAAAAQASERQKEAVQQRVAELEAQIASTTSHAETANADAQNLLRELRADTKTAQDARQAAEDKLARFKTEMHNLRDDVRCPHCLTRVSFHGCGMCGRTVGATSTHNCLHSPPPPRPSGGPGRSQSEGGSRPRCWCPG